MKISGDLHYSIFLNEKVFHLNLYEIFILKYFSFEIIFKNILPTSVYDEYIQHYTIIYMYTYIYTSI